jgi:predicted transcriptional regulator
LAVRQLLWERGSLTARSIRESSYSEGIATQHGTAQRLLQWLGEKMLLIRDWIHFVHLFCRTLIRDRHASRQLKSLAEKFTASSAMPFLMHIAEYQKKSARELKTVRDLMNEGD